MAFYHSIYGTGVAGDEDHYLAHRLAFASQTDVMDLSRITRQREAEIASSLIRYAPPRGVGMFQELSQVYGENSPTTHQQSFESDDGFQTQAGYNVNQGYRSYPYAGVPEANISNHQFSSSSPGGFGSSGDIRHLQQQQQHQQMVGVQGTYGEPQNQAQMPVAHPHDLPSVINRPELQWLVTTSNVDIRTLTPPSTVSSPHVGLPPLYHNQPSSPHQIGHHMIDDSATSLATISHHQMHPRYQGIQEPPPLQRMPKRTATTATGQPKPKGTPGRKRKVPDHDLSPAEATKRHIRRERNKVAAAKCRNRRRELTDRLQGETDQLEESQNILHQEIMTLQQEKEHLEFILAAHSPNCKAGIVPDVNLMQHEDHGMMRDSSSVPSIPELSLVAPPEVMDDTPQHHGSYFSMHEARQQEQQAHAAAVSVITAAPSVSRHSEPCYDVSASSQSLVSNPIPTDLSQHGQAFPSSTRSNRYANMTLDTLDTLTDGPLNTPVCTLATPSVSTGVFTFPSTQGMTSSTATTDTNFQFSSTIQDYAPRHPPTPSYTASMTFSALQGHQQQPYTCAAAHRRSSSSESHQSLDSVQSPKLLAL